MDISSHKEFLPVIHDFLLLAIIDQCIKRLFIGYKGVTCYFIITNMRTQLYKSFWHIG